MKESLLFNLLFTLGWRRLRLDQKDIEQIFNAVKMHGIENFEAGLEQQLKQRIASLENWRMLAERELAWLSQNQFQLVHIGDDCYPSEFYQLKFPPLALVAKGDLRLLNTGVRLAAVGSRKMVSKTREWIESEYTDFLRASKIITVSGGAVGVDQAVHKAALRAGIPTICVLPSGMNRIYPQNLGPLIDLIIDRGGLVLSQFSPFQDIYKYHFVIRNELIVRMSDATLVLEASLRSGSMLTAQLAADANKTVMTLPVHPSEKYGGGNLSLLATGAVLICRSADITAAMKKDLNLRVL